VLETRDPHQRDRNDMMAPVAQPIAKRTRAARVAALIVSGIASIYAVGLTVEMMFPG
jgi:hypothetical protein